MPSFRPRNILRSIVVAWAANFNIGELSLMYSCPLYNAALPGDLKSERNVIHYSCFRCSFFNVYDKMFHRSDGEIEEVGHISETILGSRLSLFATSFATTFSS